MPTEADGLDKTFHALGHVAPGSRAAHRRAAKSGLVRSEKTGRVRTCRLEPAPMRSVEQWIAQHRATWEDRLGRLGDVVDATYGRTE